MATLNGTSGNDVLTGTSGKDDLYGLGGADRLWGRGGDDYLVGGAGADALYGEANDDWLIGGAGGDTLDGGPGTDMASYWGSGAGVTVRLDEAGGASPSGGHATGDRLIGIENLQGTPHVDTLTGNSKNNALNGMGGDDEIRGGGGDDWLTGGAGRDTLDGGPGTDMASYTGSGAGVTVSLNEAGGASPSGGHATGDRLIGIENLQGTPHVDTLTGNSKNNVLNGMGGDDEIRGGGGNDTLTGGAGRDTLNGGEGTADEANYWNSDAGVTVSLNEAGGASPSGGHATGDRLTGIESVTGSAHRDVLTGNSKNNGLVGRDGDDEIRGGGGNDWLAGDAGADAIYGGEGRDTASYTGSDAGVTVTLDEAGGASPSGGHATGDRLSGIEIVVGSAHDDRLTGNSKNDSLDGSGGVDRLWGRGGDDYLVGGAGADALYGEANDDWLIGGAGGDTLDGGPGTDMASYWGSGAGVTVSLNEAGGASPSGGHATGDRLMGIESVTGSAHRDVLTGNSKNNVLNGMGGDDEIRGGGGNDTLTGGAGRDTLNGGEGTADEANYWNSGAGVTVRLNEAGGASPSGGHATGDRLMGIESVTGSAHRDVLTGNSKNNVLRGLSGDDEIRGGGGNDYIQGGAGADDLEGGPGADRFVFVAAADSTSSARDVIKDFSSSAGDRIDLRDLLESGGTFTGTDPFAGVAGEVRYTQQTVSGTAWTDVFVDVNGDRAADLVVRLEGTYDLDASDFLLAN